MVAVGIVAFCFYLLFNYAVPFDYFNHDLGGLFRERGHMGYMWHIWKNWSLPVFSIDPVSTESYYNPPLHYILGALWIRSILFFTDSMAKGFEGLQVLTSIYMGFVLFFFYKILYLLKIKHKILIWTYLCFNPMLFIMSSIINNDGLSFLTSIATFYYGLKWYQEPTLKTMIKAAVWSGLGLMAKLNGAVIIIFLAFLFVVRFLKNKKERYNYCAQLLFYILIALPLGGWYYGYAYFRYHTPVNYIQGWKNPNADIGARHTFYERLTHDEYSDIYVNLRQDKQWNMLALGLKTSLFDEHNYKRNASLHLASGALFYFSIAFFFTICFCALWYLLYRPFSKADWDSLILASYIVLLFSFYFVHNYYYPHPYSANFRFMPMFFVGAACLWDKLIRDKTVWFYLPFFVSLGSIIFHIILIQQRLF